MSAIDGSGRGHLLISYLFQNDYSTKQVDEEYKLKADLQKFMNERGYRFIMADDDFINEKLKKE